MAESCRVVVFVCSIVYTYKKFVLMRLLVLRLVEPTENSLLWILYRPHAF